MSLALSARPPAAACGQQLATGEICYDVPGLLQQFESLGENCDFGVLQRAVGVEPFGLLKFAAINPGDLSALLRARLEPLGEPGDLFLREDGPHREYCVRSRRYSYEAHTETYAGQHDPEAVRIAQGRKLRFLKAGLLRDLTAARKLFVLKTRAAPVVRPIAADLQAYGENQLLWIDQATATHPPGTVLRLSDTLLRGFISRFGTYDLHPSLPVSELVTLCANAWRLWRGTEPPRTAVTNLIGPDAAVEVGPLGQHRLASSGRELLARLRVPVTHSGSHVFSAWIRLPESFSGRLVVPQFDGLPTLATWRGDLRTRGAWQRIWARAEVPEGATLIGCDILAEAAPGDMFESTGWCLERGSRPSGYGFTL